MIGFGTRKMNEGDTYNCVRYALETGYRHIDTAKIYGNEKAVGRAIKDLGISRNEIVITTKLPVEDMGYYASIRSFLMSLKNLGVDYIDTYLIHWPEKKLRQETWKALESLYKTGRIKNIGVSNYSINHLEEMKKYATIFPSINQIEFHPFCYNSQIVNYCITNDIQIQGYSPLVHGQKFKNIFLKNLAEKYKKTVSQILLRWAIQLGVTPLPKSVNKQNIKENFEITDFEISFEDMNKICELTENFRICGDPDEY